MCQTFQTDAAIGLACDQDRVLREHFPLVARSHRKEMLPPELEEIYELRHLEQEEDEDDKRRQHGLFQSGKSGSSSDNTVTRDIRSQRSWLVHYGMQEQGEKPYGLFSKSYVVQRAKHDLYRCHPVQECYHAAYVLTSALALIWLTWEVRDGTSAKALNVVCWSSKLFSPLWTSYTAKTVMNEFKVAWVKHYGWPEIIVHDQGPEFMGSEFQNPVGAAGVLTMPLDSQSPWQNGKTERAGQSFKHQLWDLDEECHIEGETEFEAAVAECCDARSRYCNRFLCASTRVWFQPPLAC